MFFIGFVKGWVFENWSWYLLQCLVAEPSCLGEHFSVLPPTLEISIWQLLSWEVDYRRIRTSLSPSTRVDTGRSELGPSGSSVNGLALALAITWFPISLFFWFLASWRPWILSVLLRTIKTHSALTQCAKYFIKAPRLFFAASRAGKPSELTWTFPKAAWTVWDASFFPSSGWWDVFSSGA